MSQQNKRTTAKRAAAKSKKTRARSRNKKGAKVYIPASKIIVLCAVVVISCSALLFVTTALDQRQKKATQKIEQIEKKKQIVKNESFSSNEGQKEKTRETSVSKGNAKDNTKDREEREIERDSWHNDSYVSKGNAKNNTKDNGERSQSPSKTKPQKATQKSLSKADSPSVASPSSQSSVAQASANSSKSSSPNPTQTSSAKNDDASKRENVSSENKTTITSIEKAKENQKEQASFQMEKAGKTEIAMKPVEKAPISEKMPTSEKKDSPKQAADIPEIPIARPGAKLVVIFDDGGQNLQQLEKCLALPFPITIAILPKLRYSKAAADRTRAAGKDVMLHQPMQAIARSDGTVPNPGEGAIKPDMPLDEIERIVRENIAEIGPIVGLNNHEGSAICEDEGRIGAVLNVANDRGVFFLDSRTTSQTRVPQAAMGMGYSYYERNVFLDNTKNRADIIAEIMRGVSIANKTGAAIMIGHVWSADVLPPILAELYPLLRAKGYEFTTVPESGALITP